MLLCGFGDDGHHFVRQGLNHASAKHHDFGTQDVDEISYANTDIFGGLLDDFADEFVAAANGLAQIAAAKVFQSVSQHFGQQGLFTFFDTCLDALKNRCATGQSFEAALVATAALGAIYINDHMADFARGMVESTVEVAIDDKAAANSSSHKDSGHMARFGFEFGDMDTEYGNIGVVFHKHRHAKLLLEFLLERHVLPPFHVGSKDDASHLEIHRAGSADAHAGYLFHRQIGFIHGVLNAALDALDDGFYATLGFGADFSRANALERVVKNPGQDFRASQIDANDVFRFVAGFSHVKLFSRQHSADFLSQFCADNFG